MRFTAQHTVTISSAPWLRFVVQEVGALSTLHFEQAMSATDSEPEETRTLRRMELASEYLAVSLVKVHDASDSSPDGTMSGPFAPGWAAETLTVSGLFELLREARSAGLPKTGPSPSGDGTPT